MNAASRLLASALVAAMPFAAQAAQDTAKGAPTADAAFVKEASAAGLAEVALGQMGASQGQSSEVKTFGQQMVTDHGKANTELKGIADTKGLQVSTSPTSKDEAASKAIGAKSGADFDKAFGQKMVMDHRKAVALFAKESTSGKDPELKAFATKTLPTLKEHLDMAQKLPGASMSHAAKAETP
jgi:putative membrane protein